MKRNKVYTTTKPCPIKRENKGKFYARTTFWCRKTALTEKTELEYKFERQRTMHPSREFLSAKLIGKLWIDHLEYESEMLAALNSPSGDT